MRSVDQDPIEQQIQQGWRRVSPGFDRLIRILSIALSVFLILFAVLWLFGQMLPATQVEKAALACDLEHPGMMRFRIRDVQNYPGWRSSVQKVQILASDPDLTIWREFYSQDRFWLARLVIDSSGAKISGLRYEIYDPATSIQCLRLAGQDTTHCTANGLYHSVIAISPITAGNHTQFNLQEIRYLHRGWQRALFTILGRSRLQALKNDLEAIFCK